MRKIAEAKSVEAAAALPDPLKEALKKPPSPTLWLLSETLVKRQPSCWSKLFFPVFFSVCFSSFLLRAELRQFPSDLFHISFSLGQRPLFRRARFEETIHRIR